MSIETLTFRQAKSQLENVGKLKGNAHHVLQQIAKYASDELASRWIDNNGDKSEQ